VGRVQAEIPHELTDRVQTVVDLLCLLKAVLHVGQGKPGPAQSQVQANGDRPELDDQEDRTVKQIPWWNPSPPLGVV